MTHVLPSQASPRIHGRGFWHRTWAMLLKEFIQLRRDRLSFAMIVVIPLVQLMLFGYAINTNPRHLPTAVLLQENSDVGRAIYAALKNTDYFDVIEQPRTEAEMDELLSAGKVLFGIEIPANFERKVRRGEKPPMLIIADATDPVASGSALGSLNQIVVTALEHERGIPVTTQLPFEIRTHARYNPAGESRLNASAAFHSATPTASLNARVRITLIDPNGTYVGDSRPQGLGNYGNLQIANPAAGTWTAYVYSRDSAHGGYIGPVLFGVSVARYTSFGRISPSSATLAPGGSVAVQVRTSTPAQPGDASGAIVVRSNPARGGSTTSTTVPVTLRSLIPAGNQTFSGTVTGGNGRAPISGQEFFYQLDVPAGQPELNATITVQDPGNQFGAYLIDPQGEAVAYATNMVPGATPSSPPDGQLGAQLHTLNPAPGRWRLAVVFAPVVSGNSLSSPFEVSVNQQPVPASAGGLPNAASTQLTAGQSYTYNVTVKNTGTAPEMFFGDARLPGSAPFTLGAVSGASDNLPANDNLPVYLVPTNSTQFQAQATTTGATPLLFESQFVGGDPDLASTIGTTASLSFADNPIATGEWDVLPVAYGTFGTTGPPSEATTTSASVVTSPFDAAVSSPTGDLESDSANPATSLDSFKPITVAPGQTGTIPVTITPSGASGTKVTGTLYLDDTAYFEFGSIQDALVNYPQADEVAALPYQYTIK